MASWVLLYCRRARTAPSLSSQRYSTDPCRRRSLSIQSLGLDEIPFDALRDFASKGDGAGSVKAIRLEVPLPLLADGVVLVDTPGLLQSDAMDETAYAELFRADLAVVVLAGDKILSAEERSAAAAANDLLLGNVVFVVNRMDLVGADDRDEVLEWARAALRETGNPLVGRAHIFATSAVQTRESISPPIDLQEFKAWLAGFFASEVSSQVALVSRLGILEHRLQEAAVGIRREREQAERHEADARSRHDERVITERSAVHRAIAEGRLRLQTVQTRTSCTG